MTKPTTPATIEEESDRAVGARSRTKQPAARIKKQHLIRFLRLKSGADITSLGAKLRWQPHTIRAAISGLRKAGYEIETERAGKGRPCRYRIVAHPAQAS